ncbi:MAG: MraY family glycosyltransferase [Tepidisphaeraceae bacterium]|jgi:UDP-GlcNAc:undecaprenyl-phosphate GlcNAc-1-phosphate transferase
MLNVLAVLPNLTWDDVLSPHIYVFYGAFLLSFIFTPLMRAVAITYGIVDSPDRVRKFHTAPVAYLGGVAVSLGWVAGLAISQLHLVAPEVGTHLRVKLSIVAGGGVIVALGLWDDLRHIRPRLKIVGQVIAALLLLTQHVGTNCLGPVLSPLQVRLHDLIGPDFNIPQWLIGFLSSITVILIVVGCSNATNLLDGLDGLCGGVTAVIGAGYLFLAVHLATQSLDPDWDMVRIILSLALLGSVLGFVPYNFNPASIFMGDAGSMFLGYACAVMIILMGQEQPKWFMAAMVMFALPVLDTSLAFARRWVNRRPFFSADRHHFHHQLLARGYSIRKTVVISYLLAVAFCVLGAMMVFIRARYAVAVYMVIFGSIIVAAYKMGMVHERQMLAERESAARTPVS